MLKIWALIKHQNLPKENGIKFGFRIYSPLLFKNLSGRITSGSFHS